jgi:hypothetical protein
MAEAERFEAETLGEQVALLMMREVLKSRRNPTACRRSGWGALREEIGPAAPTEAAPGVPFLHPPSDTRNASALAMAKLCRFCGACEMARR